MCILTLLATSQFALGATIRIPATCFDPYTSLEYFAYLYPWGSDHNGSAQMVGNSSDHEYISVLPLSQSPSVVNLSLRRKILRRYSQSRCAG
jgi:hypothetical protein